MHFLSKPVAAAARSDGPPAQAESSEPKEETRDRQAAALCLHAAANTDQATSRALRRRAARLLLHRGQQ